MWYRVEEVIPLLNPAEIDQKIIKGFIISAHRAALKLAPHFCVYLHFVDTQCGQMPLHILDESGVNWNPLRMIVQRDPGVME